MTTFDSDDDVRRDESDELHGQAGGWFARGIDTARIDSLTEAEVDAALSALEGIK